MSTHDEDQKEITRINMLAQDALNFRQEQLRREMMTDEANDEAREIWRPVIDKTYNALSIAEELLETMGVEDIETDIGDEETEFTYHIRGTWPMKNKSCEVYVFGRFVDGEPKLSFDTQEKPRHPFISVPEKEKSIALRITRLFQ